MAKGCTMCELKAPVTHKGLEKWYNEQIMKAKQEVFDDIERLWEDYCYNRNLLIPSLDDLKKKHLGDSDDC